MSQENVEIVKALFAAGEAMDKQGLLAVLPDSSNSSATGHRVDRRPSAGGRTGLPRTRGRARIVGAVARTVGGVRVRD